MHHHGRLRLGDFELELSSGELSNDGHRTTLPQQPFLLLKTLLSRPGEVVTREELREQLWSKDTFVDYEHGLNAAIKRLRLALGDSADVPRFIETIPRRGYRYIGPITHLEPRPTGEIEPSGETFVRERSMGWRRPRSKLVTLTVLAFAVSATFGRLWWNTRVRGSHFDSTKIQRTLTRLTFGNGFDTDPSWSPDGKFIAFASDRSGNFDIWVQPTSGGPATRLTHSNAAETQPAWSPDGSDVVVFRSDRDGGGLFAIPAHGGPERRLTKFGFRPKWSPDGSTILFVSTDLYDGIVPKLFVISREGGPERQLLSSLMTAGIAFYTAVWHPDGRRISMVGLSQRGWLLHTVSVSGANPVDTELEGHCQLPAWSGERGIFQWAPLGNAIYLACEHDFTFDLWRFAIDPHTQAITGSERITTGTDQILPIALSRDGKQVAVTARTMRLRVWTYPFDAARARILGRGEPMTDPAAYVGMSQMSADGRRLAYALSRPGSKRTELWTTDLESRQSRRISDDDQDRDFPVWSRDLNILAYSWRRTNPTSGLTETALAIAKADGSNARFITTPGTMGKDGPFIGPTDYSVDGRSILGTSNVRSSTSSPNPSSAIAAKLRLTPPEAAVYGITLWPVDAAPKAELNAHIVASDGDYSLWQPRFSPNGLWISFLALRQFDFGRTNVVHIVGASATRTTAKDWTSVTDPESWVDRPRWSPDGKILYFSKPDGTFWNLWAIRFDPEHGRPVGGPFRVTNFETAGLEISPMFTFAADIDVASNKLALTMMERTGSLWMIDNIDR